MRADLRVYVGLDRLDLFAGQRLGMREVEPEVIGRDQAALLGHVRAELTAERRVEQVRRAVVGANAVAASASTVWWTVSPSVSSPATTLVRSTWSLPSGFDVSSTSPSKPLSVVSFPVSPVLTAAFAVERRLVEQDVDRLADFGALDALPSLTIASTTPSPSSPE